MAVGVPLSRVIVHWALRESMVEAEVEISLQRARENFLGATPRIISDNGPQFIARDFKTFLRVEVEFLPIDSPTMLRAPEFWAHARNLGRAIADRKELDADAILAAQAERAQATVLTENLGHLTLFVKAIDWRHL